MPIGFQVEVTGSEELQNALKKIGNGIIDLSDEFENTGKYLIDFTTQQVFETEGQIFASPWAQLSKPYTYTKRRKYPNRGILEATGNMRRGFMFTILNSRAALFHNIYDESYLQYHQEGTQNMPKRVIYKLDNERKEAIRDIFTTGIHKKIKIAFNA